MACIEHKSYIYQKLLADRKFPEAVLLILSKQISTTIGHIYMAQASKMAE